MPSYVFMTDSDSDLPYTYVDELDIKMVYMPYVLNGQEYFDDLGRNARQKEYFDRMRAGETPVTSLLPVAAYLEYIEPYFKLGQDILFIAFSSQMSSTIENLRAAREELLKKYPERKMIIVDTLSISAPMFLLVLKAYELYAAGKPMEEVAQWVEEHKLRAQAWLTVDDLKYLRRGGRISAVSATMGTMLDLKPIIIEGRGGKMDAVDKVQGRKRALRVLAERTAQNIEDPEEQLLIILHADAQEDADRLETLIREAVPTIKEIRQYLIGPVIGAHCGPGTIAACFLGKERPA